ncbi:hypothetical protein [Lysinibacillus sp. NPDC096212]|uniref:hypothetical protein n=1 Tax=unclassified Lysinibacillus TaxID=2636778 RepID=UPI003812B482
MNIQTYQISTDLNIVRWESIDSISEKINEVRNSQKQYTNDVIEIHQVVDFGRITEGSPHKILIIFNCKRDLDNLGEKIIL